MLSGMSPSLDERPHKYAKLSLFWVFAMGSFWLFGHRFAVIWEDEGIYCIVPTTTKDKASLFGKITLEVHSALEGVGLTAAVSTALADAGIACNVIAAFHHDHLFVPWERREEALGVLEKLSSDAAS